MIEIMKIKLIGMILEWNNQPNTQSYTNRLRDGNHHKSYNLIDTEVIGAKKEQQIKIPENPYQDNTANKKDNVTEKKENEKLFPMQNEINEYSRNKHQNLDNIKSNKDFSVIFT